MKNPIKIIKDYFKDTPDNYKQKNLDVPISAIPPCSILVTRAKSVIGYTIRHFRKSWGNHIALYFGSGKHEIIEALPNGIKKTKLESYLNKKSQFKIYCCEDLTVSEMQIIKAYAYGTVGRKYDYKGLAGFVFGVKQNEEKNFCSEMAVEAFGMINRKISKKPANLTAPDDIDYYLENYGKDEGWILLDTFNC